MFSECPWHYSWIELFSKVLAGLQDRPKSVAVFPARNRVQPESWAGERMAHELGRNSDILLNEHVK